MRGIFRVALLNIGVALLLVAVTDARAGDSLYVAGAVAHDSLGSHQNSSSSSTQHVGSFDWLTNLPGDWYHWGQRTFVTDNLPAMGIVAVATAATIWSDREVYDALHTQYLAHPWYHDLSDRLTWIGDGKFQFGIAVALGIYGLGWHDERAVRTASQTVEVILACGGVVQLLKHTTGRESPFTATQPTGRWVFFPNQIEYAKHVPHYDAFPSGHVATALATMTVLAENYPEQEWIPWVGYPMIAGLAMGMIANGIHWWSDYPLSIALGLGFGHLVARSSSPDATTPSSGVKTSWYPAIMPDGMGVGFGMCW